MKFTWNLEYKDFNWMCIFTWLSVLNVIVFPITILIKIVFIKGIFRPISKLLDKLDDYLDKKAEIWARNNLYRVNSYGDGKYDFSFLLKASKRERETFFDKVCLMWTYGRYQDFRDAYYSTYSSKVRAIRYKKEETREQRVQKIFKIGSFLKPIATVLLWAAGTIIVGFAVYGIVKGILALTHVPPHGWWMFVKVVIGIILGVGIIILGAWGCASLDDNKLFKARMARFGWIIITPFRLLGRLIVGLFHLIKDTISDNCPAIEWED